MTAPNMCFTSGAADWNTQSDTRRFWPIEHTEHTMTLAEILASINHAMHEGSACPVAGCIGECAMLDRQREGSHWYIAALYLWDKTFNDASIVAQWFFAIGASEVTVQHVLFDSFNQVKDGICEIDGARAWHVYFEHRGITDENHA